MERKATFGASVFRLQAPVPSPAASGHRPDSPLNPRRQGSEILKRPQPQMTLAGPLYSLSIFLFRVTARLFPSLRPKSHSRKRPGISANTPPQPDAPRPLAGPGQEGSAPPTPRAPVAKGTHAALPAEGRGEARRRIQGETLSQDGVCQAAGCGVSGPAGGSARLLLSPPPQPLRRRLSAGPAPTPSLPAPQVPPPARAPRCAPVAATSAGPPRASGSPLSRVRLTVTRK